MYNLASNTEYDVPVELTSDELNEYIACLPDGPKAMEIKDRLLQSLLPNQFFFQNTIHASHSEAFPD